MQAIIVFENKKDKELLNLINSKVPLFIEYINYNTKSGRKEAYQIKSHWGAKQNPFVVLKEGKEIVKVFYSEKENAVQQLINYLNDCKNQEIK